MTIKEMIKTEIEKLPENLLVKASQKLSTAHLKRFGTIKRMLSMTTYKIRAI